MPKKSGFIERMQQEVNAQLAALRAEYEAKYKEERHCARVFQMDMVTIALGRMGWGEKRLGQLDDMLMEVARDMDASVKEEMQYDPDLWITQDRIEQEIKRYAGKRYVPAKERYFG